MARAPHFAITRASARPAVTSTMLSARNCCASRVRVAPIAVRMASSRPRAAAMRSTSVTAVRSSSIGRFAPLTTRSCIGNAVALILKSRPNASG